ncbi:MAG: D-tagatose-bisphosphate aldolase, class II, non-catalytic subunit [Fidelibacterota bacterium]|nr:MAG: D-tagatose-bisphosphate aldolase, class II, non-catalytic subunit [Candidatus Neomarinimicrobiota bacterium]
MIHPLIKVVRSQAEGEHLGIYSVCSANRFVIEATVLQAKKDGMHALIEATSNQVDQFGGYTGMTPAQFVTYVYGIAQSLDYPRGSILLGGDHLGPNRWRNESAEEAMSKARELVQAYVSAGFTKIHLDTSMRLGDDPGDADIPPTPEVVAERASDLALVAEEAYEVHPGNSSPPYYIIGTDVPHPGGAQEATGRVHVTSKLVAQQTIQLHQEAFRKRDLQSAWDRVIGIVVQPGVEFGDGIVEEYKPEKAVQLSRLIEEYDNLVYEAHSTDYQTGETLRKMVADHYAILKVGPWLTFAFREALFALAYMESEWLSAHKSVALSNLRAVLEDAMISEPVYWQDHYHGDEHQQQYARKYSYSDRVRYYWPVTEVQAAVARLIANLEHSPPPLTLVSQHMPNQYRAIREGRIKNTPQDMIHDKIMEVTELYARACGNSLKSLQ